MAEQNIAANVDQNGLEIDGRFYQIGLLAYFEEGEKMYPSNIQLKYVELIDFSSKFNDPVSRGQIIFTDKNGSFDRFTSRPYSYVTMNIESGVMKKEGVAYDIIDKISIDHTFIIDNIQVLQKKDSNVKYKIDMVSKTSLNLQQRSYSSTLGSSDGKKTFFKFIQDYLNGIEIQTSGDFLENDSENKINYITGCGDTFISFFKHISNKIYSDYGQQNSGLRGIFYSFIDDKMHSIRLGSEFSNSVSIQLTMKEGGQKSLFNGEKDVKIGTVVRKGNRQVIESTHGIKRYKYDFTSNTITPDDYSSGSLMQIFSKDDSTRRIQSDKFNSNNCIRICSQWDEPTTLYYDMVSNMIDYNSPILEITGNLKLMVGDGVSITIPDKDDITDTNMYTELEGNWSIAKVEDMIDIPNRRFRQKLCLTKVFLNTVK